ncbi:MAG: tRNA (adenosine(37)-N6)-threonylcarbamoyltransferase complex dimerization subunit type 1 TsaB [Myxococcales bacterium]|nr:tRNA (adenosine(37)-N6)-threonylcarbamoyltransferase complex dimerization subunit type 1 TsaB [Myxococcales bacterium]
MLLAIETATQRCSVAALPPGGPVLAYTLEPKTRASVLANLVSQIAAEHGHPSRYVIDVGPGSFTGLRVGVAFLKGLARACPGPVQVLHSLEVLAADILAAAAHPHAVAVPLLKASGVYVFAGAFIEDNEGLPQPCEQMPLGLYVAAELADRIHEYWPKGVWRAGEAVCQVPNIKGDVLTELIAPKATTLLRISERRVALGRAAVREAAMVEPAYFQLSAAEAKRIPT